MSDLPYRCPIALSISHIDIGYYDLVNLAAAETYQVEAIRATQAATAKDRVTTLAALAATGWCEDERGSRRGCRGTHGTGRGDD